MSVRALSATARTARLCRDPRNVDLAAGGNLRRHVKWNSHRPQESRAGQLTLIVPIWRHFPHWSRHESN